MSTTNDQAKELTLWGFSSVLTRNIVVGIILLLVSLLGLSEKARADALQRERDCRQELTAKVEQLLREQINTEQTLTTLETRADSITTTIKRKRKR